MDGVRGEREVGGWILRVAEASTWSLSSCAAKALPKPIHAGAKRGSSLVALWKYLGEGVSEAGRVRGMVGMIWSDSIGFSYADRCAASNFLTVE